LEDLLDIAQVVADLGATVFRLGEHIDDYQLEILPPLLSEAHATMTVCTYLFVKSQASLQGIHDR
jgi:hypothetical protein